jgi:hypothetical protein
MAKEKKEKEKKKKKHKGEKTSNLPLTSQKY